MLTTCSDCTAICQVGQTHCPRKRRRLTSLAKPALYKSSGVPARGLPAVRLLQQELEALRLAHLEGLNQTEAAAHMSVSRSTFQRILSQAHHTVALALSEGHALAIDGGTYDVDPPTPRGPRRD